MGSSISLLRGCFGTIHRAVPARWMGAVAAGLLLGAAPAGAQAVIAPVTDTLRVLNTAQLTFQGPDGGPASVFATATVLLEQMAGVALVPSREATVNPGTRRALAHTLTNAGNGTDQFIVRPDSATARGWSFSIYYDVDGDGALGARDTLVTSPIELASGQSAGVLLVVNVPASAADQTQLEMGVRATSQLNAAASTAVLDRFTVRVPRATLTVGKTVDRASATYGDTLTYTLAYANGGDGAAANTQFADTLPGGLRYLRGTLRLNNTALTDTADADAGRVETDSIGRAVVRIAPGTVAPGDSGTASFRAVVTATTREVPTLRNVAVLAYDTVRIATPGAATQILSPELRLSKERIGTDTVRVGSAVSFRIRYWNASATMAVRDLAVVDSLPAELAYVSATGAPAVDGQVLTWKVGTLAPGDSGSFVVETAARAPTNGGAAAVINRVTARGSNAEAVSATAVAFSVLPIRGDELELRKAAGVLEASPGGMIPFTITLRNRALIPISGIVVKDLLPEGTTYQPNTLTGADSARLEGRELRIYYNGPLAAQGERQIRYALLVVNPRGRTIINRAVGEAEDGRIRSDTAVAQVRLRRGFGMQNRLLVGKVWLDRNLDGRQQTGEEGVAGIDVYSADGQVVTTDAEGRFSFPDLPAGTHLVRLDARRAPAGFTVPRPGDDQVTVRMDGWTLPRVSFRLVPASGQVTPRPVATDTARVPAPVSAAPTAPPAAERIDSATVPAAPVVPAMPAAPVAPKTGDGTARPARVVAPPVAGPSASAPKTQDGGVRFVSEPAVLVAAAAPALPATTVPAEVRKDSARALSVAPLRAASERAAEDQRAFAEGPAVRFARPSDGIVVATDRIFIKIRGEAGAAVRLYDEEKVIAETSLRPDGAQDFLNIPLAEGPHRLRVWMMNSWQRERWDSIAVHRTGKPARIEALAAVPVLHADAQDTARVAARVLDAWGVPVANSPNVTVEGRGATVFGVDADAGSPGIQLRADSTATILIPVTGGRTVGMGELRLSAGDAAGRLPVRVYPTTQRMIATGIAQVGVGAAAESFGALTVRGALDAQTSLSVSYDSRRGRREDDYFGRGYDVNAEERYPTVGDGSERRVLSAATQKLSARLERGFDWVELGDIRTDDFTGGNELGGYRRALTGVGSRVTTGPVAWRSFGSITNQALVQRQIRGNGSSGPYRFGAGARPGTERVSIEVRARDNAARLLNSQQLVRYVDYQIDYTTGEVLLQRPIPAEDAAGNPVFVVATMELRSGGEARFVGGMRMELNAATLLRGRTRPDSLGVSFFGVRDGAGSGTSLSTPSIATTSYLGGTDVMLRQRGLEVGAQVMRFQGDSSANAARATVAWTFSGDRARLAAQWMKVGRGFNSAMDPRLGAGLEELRLAARYRIAQAGRLQLTHERSRFEQFGVQRNNTTLAWQQSVFGRAMTAQGGLANDQQGGLGGSSTATGKLSYAATSKLDVWIEGARNLSAPTTPALGAVPARPDQIGAGASFRILPKLRVEGAHRWVSVPGTDSTAGSYQVTSMNLRSDVLFGQAWGGLERTDANRALHYAVLGWNQRVAVAGGWSVSSLFERRVGLSRAAIADPSRALPFVQQEPDRWSAGLGLEWMPANQDPRFSVRGELRDGRDSRGRRIDLAGDLPLGRSVALLARSDWLRDERLTGVTEGAGLSRRDRSLLGLAVRPVGTENLNALAKIEWRRTLNPLALGGPSAGLGAVGEDTRLIGSTDLVWAPTEKAEIAGRYAVRWTLADPNLPGITSLGSRAQYFGLRMEQGLDALSRAFGDPRLDGRLRARLDSRMLLVGAANEARWNVAPSLLLRLTPQLEVEGGYRLGTLQDPDFADNGGRGFFATLGFRFTEGTLGSAASFWRARLAGEGQR